MADVNPSRGYSPEFSFSQETIEKLVESKRELQEMQLNAEIELQRLKDKRIERFIDYAIDRLMEKLNDITD